MESPLRPRRPELLPGGDRTGAEPVASGGVHMLR